MLWQDEVWRLPLGMPPAPLRIWGRAVHGKSGIERWRVPFWALNLYRASGELRINGKSFPIRPGFASLTPPDVDFEYRYTGSAILTWAHFTTGAGAEADRCLVPIPVMQDLGPRFETVRTALIEAGMASTDRPVRAKARLWDLLWMLTETATPLKESGVAEQLGIHPGLYAGLSFIEDNLHTDISVDHVCRHANLSQAHLYRLCHAFTGTSPSGYIRRLRMERALKLLRQARMTISAIGAEVGIRDPHAFNKAIRRTFGRSPSDLRQGLDPIPPADGKGGEAPPEDD